MFQSFPFCRRVLFQSSTKRFPPLYWRLRPLRLSFSTSYVTTAKTYLEPGNVDVSKAIVSLKQAISANTKDNEALYMLGTLLIESSVSNSPQAIEGVGYLERAAALNDINAITNLASCYNYGHGVQRNVSRAISLYMRGISEKNDIISMQNLGFLYRYGKDEVAKDVEKAAEWFRRGIAVVDADKSNELSESQQEAWNNCKYQLAMLLMDEKMGSEKEIVEILLDASSHRHAESTKIVGWCFEQPYYHTKVDYTQAMHYYKLAVEQGSKTAYANVGALYELGRGVPIDYEQALTNYRMATDRGFHAPLLRIGNIYANDVYKDYNQASFYFLLAHRRGIEGAKERLQSMPKDAQLVAFYMLEEHLK